MREYHIINLFNIFVLKFLQKALLKSIENNNSYLQAIFINVVFKTIILKYTQTYIHIFFVTIIKANLGLTLNPFNRVSGNKVRLFTQMSLKTLDTMKIFDCKLSHQTI
jgi:hypothetical protein